MQDNYDKLYYPAETITRDSKYTRWVSDTSLLRTQMTSAIPSWLAQKPKNCAVLCPGIVYRRDVVDCYHVGEPHQVDIWRVSDVILNRKDLLEMIDVIIKGVIGNVQYRCNETNHYYTQNGLEVEILWNDKWVEVLECGEILPRLLIDNNMQHMTGLAMGIGLDRLAMLLKSIPDIRLLRSEDPRVRKQMGNLEPWKSVSKQPPIVRDLSIAVDDTVTVEEIGDIIRCSCPEIIDWLEEVSIKVEYTYDAVPKQAKERLGMLYGQKNVLLCIVMRHPTKSIEKKMSQEIMTNLYKVLHQGTRGYL